jgi:hypothetical protein
MTQETWIKWSFDLELYNDFMNDIHWDSVSVLMEKCNKIKDLDCPETWQVCDQTEWSLIDWNVIYFFKEGFLVPLINE